MSGILYMTPVTLGRGMSVGAAAPAVLTNFWVQPLRVFPDGALVVVAPPDVSSGLSVMPTRTDRR